MLALESTVVGEETKKYKIKFLLTKDLKPEKIGQIEQ